MFPGIKSARRNCLIASRADPRPGRAAIIGHMTSATPPAGFVHIVVGYDGSAPASRALDAAVRLLQGRAGRIVVIYVAHLSSLVMMSADAIAEMESDFGEVETELRTTAAEQLRASGAEWEFERRQGVIPDQLIATATEIRDAHPGQTVAIALGSSSQAAHRMVGSVAVSLARHSPVPLLIVP
jgi:nucleotide-binding universal stress UspA family protein